MNLTPLQFSVVAQAAAAVGATARADFLADGMCGDPCVAIEALDPKAIWNLSSLLAEHDPGLSKMLRGPAVDKQDRRATLFWPGVTVDSRP